MIFDVTAQDFNVMSEGQRKRVLRGGFGRWKLEQATRYEVHNFLITSPCVLEYRWVSNQTMTLWMTG